jgi:predicted NBD/HSP70 family sugar kinase
MDNLTKRSITDKEYKNLLVYNILRSRGEISRADLTGITRINAVSISNYVNSFIKKNLISEKQVGISSGGRPPILLELNTRVKFSIGVYINKKQVVACLADVAGKKRFEERIDIKGADISHLVTKTVSALTSKLGEGVVIGICVCPDEDLPDKAQVLRSIESSISQPLYLTTPVVAAAYNESLLRDEYSGLRFLYSYKDVGDVVYFENFGYYTYDDDSENCEYLRPWNPEMSVDRTTKKMIKDGVKTIVSEMAKGEVEEVTEAHVYEAAEKNDALATGMLELAGLNLGVRISLLINVFKPEKVIFGGGVEKAGKLFLEPVKKSVEKFAHETLAKKVDILYTGFENNDAVVTGAAALVIREIFMGA